MGMMTRKLLRDLWHLRGQAITIALVIAAGIATYVTLRGAYTSLERARDSYYRQQRFADAFAHLQLAPNAVAHRIERIAGVVRMQTRIVQSAMIPLPDVPEPMHAQVISLPALGEYQLNRVELVSGRLVAPERNDEALLIESFARARGLGVGASLPVVMNGTRYTLRVVGIVRSPEFVFAISPGEMAPDPGRFAVLFLSRAALETTFRLEGAFNDVAVSLEPGASMRGVLESLDRVLEPYGGQGAISRARQASNYALNGELDQLNGMSAIVPLIFVLVACLLVNVVMSRLMRLQHPEIATLKALGYSNLAIDAHFLQLVLTIIALGASVGVILGVNLAQRMLQLYGHYFKFPRLTLSLSAASIAMIVVICTVCAVLGAIGAVRAATRLPPAEAMRPLAPQRYRRSLIDRFGIRSWFGPASQMVFRELERRPIRALTSALAIAASVGLMVIGGWYSDSIHELMYQQFHVAMREDVSVVFSEPRPARAITELAHLPGVLQAEGLRVIPVRFRVGHRVRDGVITGYPRASTLRTPRDRFAEPVALPVDGVLLTDMLASLLDVQVGQELTIEIKEGRRLTRPMRVSGLVSEAFGLQGHMDLEALLRMLGEQDRRSLALLRVDPLFETQSVDGARSR